MNFRRVLSLDGLSYSFHYKGWKDEKYYYFLNFVYDAVSYASTMLM